MLLEVFDLLWRQSQGRANKLKARDRAQEVTTARVLKASRGLDERARECEYCHAQIKGKLYKHYYKNSKGKAAVMEICILCRDLLKQAKAR